MSERPATNRGAAPSRLRGAIATILLILLTVMIVRDIFVRRWGSPERPGPDVTHRSR
jgi:hypothetical protein